MVDKPKLPKQPPQKPPVAGPPRRVDRPSPAPSTPKSRTRNPAPARPRAGRPKANPSPIPGGVSGNGRSITGAAPKNKSPRPGGKNTSKPGAKTASKPAGGKAGKGGKSGAGGKGQARKDVAGALKASQAPSSLKREPGQSKRDYVKGKAIEGVVSSVASPAVGKAAAKFATSETGKKIQRRSRYMMIGATLAALLIISLPFLAVIIIVGQNDSLSGGYNNSTKATAATNDGLPQALLNAYGDQAAYRGLPWEIVAALASTQTNYGANANDGQDRQAGTLYPTVNPPISLDPAAPVTTTAPPATTTTVPATTVAGASTTLPAPPVLPTIDPGVVDDRPRLGPFLIDAHAGLDVASANNQSKAAGAITVWLNDYLTAHGATNATDVGSHKAIWAAALDSLPVRGADPAGGAMGSSWANGIVNIAAAWQSGTSGACAAGATNVSLPTSGPMVVGSPLGGNKGNLTADELTNAVLIVRAGQALGAPRQAMVIALMTAIVESSLTNSSAQTDHTSVGLFQQQDWWGTVAQRMDPAYALESFLKGRSGITGLYGIAGWQSMPPGDAAQAVQRSGFPDAYAVYTPAATGLYDTIMGSSASVTPVAGSPSPTSGGGVYVIGDSLTNGAKTAGFAPAGATIEAVDGMSTATGIAKVKAADLSAVQTVMVALGTNDASSSEAAYAGLIDQMMTAIGSGKNVIWVNVDASEPNLAAAATGVNPALDAAKTKYPNLIVADWNAYVNSQPNAAANQAADGVHYNAAGYKVRAEWLTTVLTGTSPITSPCGGGGSGAAGGGCDGVLLATALAAAPSTGAQTAIKAACTRMGDPYLWGGGHSPAEMLDPNPTPLPKGLDCSGLMAWAWHRAGVNIIGTTYTQIEMGQKVPSIADARPGDLVFMYGLGHVGMYLGNGKMIDDPRTGDVVGVHDVPKTLDGIRRVG